MTHAARIVWALIACACLTSTAMAQNYPTRAIRIIVPQAPGDPCDTFARMLGQYMGERLGQHLVADNRPARRTIGLSLAANAPADGYTFACGQGGNLSVIPHTMKNVPYDALKDFVPIALIATNYLALVATRARRTRPPGFVKYLKPIRASLVRSNGEGAFLHMAAELFRSPSLRIRACSLQRGGTHGSGHHGWACGCRL